MTKREVEYFQDVALIPLYVRWQPCESIILMLATDFLAYSLVAIAMVYEIADY